MSLLEQAAAANAAVRCMFGNASMDTVSQSVDAALQDTSHWSFSHQLFEKSFEISQTDFNKPGIEAAVNELQFVDLNGLYVASQILNSPLLYAHHIASRPEDIDTFTAHMNKATDRRLQAGGREKQIKMLSHAVTLGNTSFEATALFTITFGGVLGSSRMRELRNDSSRQQDIAFLQRQKVIETVLGTLEVTGMTSAASSIEEVRTRLERLFSQEGIINSLLANNRAAFGYSTEDPVKGCPGAGYAVKILRRFGQALGTEQGEKSLRALLSPRT